MKRGRVPHLSPHSAAILARVVAFVVAGVSVFAIPATFVAASAGRVSVQAALVTSLGALAIVVAASLIVRSFDPLRG